MNCCEENCCEETRWGRCQQAPLLNFDRCGYHVRRMQSGGRRDDYYEEKVVLGLVQPTDHWMSEVEARTLFVGRARNDGRRLDHWTR